MYRNIYVGENYTRKVTTPLITTDCNAYKIIWDSKCTRGSFKITAIKADGTSVFDFGTLTEDGIAEYVISNSFYDVEGPLKIFLAIVENESITTCREINFIVKEGAKELTVAENNINPVNSLAIQIAETKAELNDKIMKLENGGISNSYILKPDEDIVVTDGVVTKLLKSDYSQYEAIAFPEGITEIRLPDTNNGGDSPLVANMVIMPESLKKIGRFSFANWVDFNSDGNVEDATVVVKVREFILNEGLETIENYAFSGNVLMEKINIPDTLSKIGRGAFEYCNSLKKIVIPATVTDIGYGNFTSTTFKKEDSSVIYGFAGSEAERYAKNENFLKEYENEFVNVGSDYSTEINDMKIYVDEQIGLALEGDY